jgi:hypothetical protein
MSHVDFISKIQQKTNRTCDVYIHTYQTNYDKDILLLYPNIKGTRFLTERTTTGISSHIDGVNDIIKATGQDIEYECIIYLRIDLCLKPFFTDVLDYDRCTSFILFPSICFFYYGFHLNYDGTPRIADTILIVPRKFFHLLYPMRFTLYHDTWSQLKSIGVDDKDVGLLLNTYHDSDSQKDWNPLYYICNRPESSVWYSAGYMLDPYSMQPLKVDPKNVNDAMYNAVQKEYDMHKKDYVGDIYLHAMLVLLICMIGIILLRSKFFGYILKKRL